MSFLKNIINGIYQLIKFPPLQDNHSAKFEHWAVLWAPTVNLGDDIQTLAAINFLHKKGIYDFEFINREDLCNYNGKPVNLIMNGWFMHDLKKFPPSKHISPFFISFHCAREELIQKNIEYFKKFEPIGCRDTITVEKLKRYGIDAYFSGCLTLYFDKSTQKRNIDCVISDINKCSYIPKVNFDYSDFKNALLTSHDIENRYYRKDLYWRLFKAQQLLNIYRDAKNVITNRLHVALPSIAMGTPVKFIHANMQDERFSGYKNILLPEKSSDANDTKFSSMELSVNEIKLKFDLIELQNTNKK